jgi:single-strand DNA-binding protein
MARDINKVIITGNLTADAEMKYTSSGSCVVSFSVANNQDYKSNGQEVKKVNFINVSVWGKFGEAVFPYLKRGLPVCVDGELDHQRWTDNDGKKHSTIKVKMTNLKMFGSKKDDTNSQQNKPAAPNFNQAEFEDDIPF